MQYNISFDICAGVIILIAAGEMLFSRDLGRRSNRIFMTLIVMHFISVVFDIWSSVCNSHPNIHSVFWRDLTNYIFLGVHTSEAVVFLEFLLEQLNLSGGMKKQQRFAVWIPEILLVLLPLFLNPVNRGVFSYDAHGMYIHGSAMLLLYIGADLYMLACLILTIRYHQVLTNFQARAAILLILMSVLPMLVQSIFMPRELIEMFFQAIGFCGYMQAVENVDESRHPVTHAWNRHALFRDFGEYLLQGKKMYAVIVKVSQTASLMIVSEGSSAYHNVRMSIAEWFSRSSRKRKMKFYDCERGVYVILAPDEDTDEACRALCGEIELRFRKPWGIAPYETLIPIQISFFPLPDENISIQVFFHLITQPYIHAQEGVIYATSDELLRSFRKHADGATAERSGSLPPELQSMLDGFLFRLKTLTPAERKIFDLYVAGYEVNEIPERAYITINTVKKHNKSIYRKLQVGSREEIRMYVDLFCQCGREEDLQST